MLLNHQVKNYYNKYKGEKTMFITENQNVGDSVLFLLSSRVALANIVEASKTENAAELVSFIHNEASDYEIMHLLMNGSLPEEKYNDVAEMLLFSEFKESMMMNHEFVTEMVGEDIFENILHEVDSLYMAYSTAKPLIEFEAQTDPEFAIAQMLVEYPTGSRVSTVAKKAAETKAQYMARVNAANAATATRQKASAAAAKMKGGGGAPSYLARGKGIASKKVAAGKAVAAQKYAAGKSLAAKTGAAIQHKAGQAVKAAKSTAAATKAKLVAMTPKAKIAKMGAAARSGASSAGPSKGLVKAAKVQSAIQGAPKAIAKFAGTKAGMATGGAAAAALAIYAGAKIYKRFFSQAAKACGGQSGDAKTSCMNKYKKAAIMKQASAIQSASGTCAKSKNPEKCKAGVAAKVQALKAKAAKIAA